MEIKSVLNNVENDYPKMEQISKKRLSKKFPHKWIKLGVTSFILSLATKNTVFATDAGGLSSIKEYTVDGGMSYTKEITQCDPTTISNICNIVQIVSIVLFSMSTVFVLATMISNKKHSDNKKKIKLWTILLLVASLISFIIATIICNNNSC